jgi:hypothetical protein
MDFIFFHLSVFGALSRKNLTAEDAEDAGRMTWASSAPSASSAVKIRAVEGSDGLHDYRAQTLELVAKLAMA